MLLLAAIACEVMGSLALKGALEAPALYGAVVLGYTATFVLLAAVLRLGVPLGVAYGVWGALGVAATALLSSLLFGEALTAVMWLGLALIVLGVLVVELGSQVAHRPRDGRAL